MKQYEVIIRIW